MEIENFKCTKKDELLTKKEVCQELQVSYPTLERWRQKGLLTGYLIGTRIRYMRSDVQNLLTPKPLSV